MSSYLGASTIIMLFTAMVSFAGEMKCDSSTCTMGEVVKYTYLGGGIEFIQPNKLNDGLTANNIASFKNRNGTLTLGGHKAVGRMVWENEVSFSGGNRTFNDNFQADLMTAEIMLNGGFNIFPSPSSVDLFPFVGLGVGGNSLNFHNQTKTLGSALMSDEPDTWLWQAKFLINLGVGSDFILKAPEGDKGLIAGVRIGYTIDPYDKTKWRTNGTTISDLSALSRSGFFARIVIGGWGPHHRMDAGKSCCMKKS
jgi:hypothetical protein